MINLFPPILKLFILVGGVLSTLGALGQVISGTFELPVPASKVVLYGTRGSEHPVMDSVLISSKGRFAFPKRNYPPGFYQLGVNDSDRVDVILDPREAALVLEFHGSPLQKNVSILKSSENQRMWAFKLISRAGQEKLSAIQNERRDASPLDTGLLRSMDRREDEAKLNLEHALDSLVGIVPDGQFAYAVAVDRKLDVAARQGPNAILEVFDFSDQRLLRSSSYSKAIVLVLQSTPLETEYSLHHACDTILTAANRDTLCWSYARSFLIELFATYGPDELAQYLVDRYVVGEGAWLPPDPDLLQLAADQLRLTLGAPAPDIDLVIPGVPDTLQLSRILPDHEFTTIFFYSSTCDHCHDQMPGLRQLVLENDPEKFHVIGIALDPDTTEFQQAIVANKINWSSYTAARGWADPAAKAFGVKATPTFFVLDRTGRIVAKPMDHMELRAFLEKSLHN